MTFETATLVTALGVAALFGLAVGSFLNVVIARTPRLIEAEGSSFASVVRGLAWPPSHCGACGHDLAWRDNIPVAAWLLLRGRCRYCSTAYGVRYLLIELAAGLIAIAAVLIYGPGGQAAMIAGFGMGLMALTIIDLETQLLPDVVIAPLFALGLVYQGVYGAGLADGAMGAAAAFGVLWAIRTAYRLYSGIEGMGFGDLKLAAMLGAWIGLSAIPAALFLAFAGGALIMGSLMATGRIGRDTPVPFGPFLAGGAVAVLAAPGLPAAMARLAGF